MKFNKRLMLLASLTLGCSFFSHSMSNNTPIVGLPSVFNDVILVQDIRITPEHKKYIEMLVKRSTQSSFTGDIFIDSKMVITGNSEALPWLSFINEESILIKELFSPKIHNYYQNITAYSKANGFEKRRMLSDLNGIVNTLPDYNPDILSGVKVLTAPYFVELAMQFDFDRMSKSVGVSGNYCESSQDNPYGPKFTETDISKDIILASYSSGNFESFYTPDMKCFIDLVFESEALAEEVEDLYNKGNLYVTNEFELTGDAIGNTVIGVGRKLVLLKKVEIDGGKYEFQYVTHFTDQRSIKEILDTTPFDNRFRAQTLVRTKEQADAFMNTMNRVQGVFGVWTYPLKSFIRYVDNNTFDFVILNDSDKTYYGAYSRYKLVNYAGIYYAVKVSTVNRNFEFSDAFVMSINSDGNPTLKSVGLITQYPTHMKGELSGNKHVINVDQGYAKASWDDMVKIIAGDVELKPYTTGYRGFTE